LASLLDEKYILRGQLTKIKSKTNFTALNV